MSESEIIVVGWLVASSLSWLGCLVMVRITLGDYHAAVAQIGNGPDPRGARQIARMFLRLALALLTVQSSFVVTAAGALVGATPLALRIVLLAGSLGTGVVALVWYLDRRNWQRR